MRIHARLPLDKIPSFDFDFQSLLTPGVSSISEFWWFCRGFPDGFCLLPKSQWESLDWSLLKHSRRNWIWPIFPLKVLNLACPPFKPGPERIWNMMKRNQKREECSLAVCFEFWPRSTHLIKITNVSRQMNQVSKNKVYRQHDCQSSVHHNTISRRRLLTDAHSVNSVHACDATPHSSLNSLLATWVATMRCPRCASVCVLCEHCESLRTSKLFEKAKMLSNDHHFGDFVRENALCDFDN